jgi:hypothetical protein
MNERYVQSHVSIKIYKLKALFASNAQGYGRHSSVLIFRHAMSIVIDREGTAQGKNNIIRVGAPGKAWRLLRGGSPRRVRPNQPPVSSVADIEEDAM